MSRLQSALIWTALAAAIIVPLVIAAFSPLLAWRDPIYIIAGFAGIIAMGLLLLQPLLAGNYLPNLRLRQSRKLHAWIGAGLVAAVLIHVLALWITSPPDVIDVLLFRSPTPFSIWGVTAMWAVFAAAFLATFRTRLGLKPALWRLCHLTLAVIVVVGSVMHAMLIEGTMGIISKAVLCAFVLAATLKILLDVRPWTYVTRRKA